MKTICAVHLFEKSEVRNILTATTFSFTICVLCVSVFQFLPDWAGTETVSTAEVVRDIWVGLAICLYVSVWGFVCFSEKVMLKASKLARFILFSVVGYAIIAAWVFASGWCLMEGLGLFALICVIALVFADVITFVVSAKENRRLNEQLSAYKAKQKNYRRKPSLDEDNHFNDSFM